MGSDYGQWGSMDTGWGSSDDDDGSAPLKCWRKRDLTLHIDFRLYNGKLSTKIKGEQLLTGKCHHSNPYKCKAGEKETPLEEGKADQKITTTRQGRDPNIKGANFVQKEEKSCIDCPGDSVNEKIANEGENPVESMLGSDLVMKEFGAFMDDVCENKDGFSFFEINKTRLCHVKPRKKEKGCIPRFCKKPERYWKYGNPTKGMGFDGKPHGVDQTVDALSKAINKGDGLEVEVVCDAWKAAKPCLLDGGGNPLPGAADQIAKCANKEGPTVTEISQLWYYSGGAPFVDADWEAYNALIAVILKRITDCLCKAEK